MLRDLKGRALRWGLSRLGEGGWDTQLGRIKGQGAATYREGQQQEARARNKGNQRISRETKGRAAGYGAPQSYYHLDAAGSAQREMCADPEDASGRSIQLLSVIR